jgi:hypothetical protein
MKPMKTILVASFLFFCCIGYFASAVSASDCGCNAEPEGGWGPPDYTNDPSWGSSFDDLTGGGGSSSDTGGDSGSNGAGDTSSGGDSGNGGSSGGDSSSGSSSDSGSSSATVGGSAEDGVVWRIKADDLALEGLYNESLVSYNKSIMYDPYTLKPWIGKGKVLLYLERPSEAADAISRALRLDPGNTEALILLGDAQNASGNYDDAISSYTKALAMNPNLAGIGDKIAQSETAKAMMSTINSSDEAEIAVIADAEDSISEENETAQVSYPEATTVPATHAASFPGITAVLLAFGMISLLLWIRKH